MSEASPFRGWLDCPPGHVFPRAPGSLTAEAQARQHTACDIPAGLFADRIDPTLLGQDMVLMASRTGLTVDGRVHVAHSIAQHAAVRFGAGYAMEGRIERLKPVRRGHEVEVRASVQAGPSEQQSKWQAPVELTGLYLLPGLEPAADARSETPPEPTPASLALIGSLQLTPDRVKSYSADVGNLLHFDPAFAAARGFHAPIAQGLMLVTAFFGTVARMRGTAPDRFELTARFRRPAFWDDRLEFRLADETWCCVAADGRVLVEGRIRIA